MTHATDSRPSVTLRKTTGAGPFGRVVGVLGRRRKKTSMIKIEKRIRLIGDATEALAGGAVTSILSAG